MTIKQLRFVLVAVAACLLCIAPAHAKKPDNPGGGGGDPEATPFSVVELPSFSRAISVSNPDAEGLVTVAGEGPEGGYISATYAMVDVASREVIGGLLPEPTDNAPLDLGSNALAVNTAGVIVGGTHIYDETAPDNRRYGPVRWIPQGEGYTYELLPLLDEGDSYGSVHAVNDAGTMVGTSQTYDTYRPALWSADGTTVVDPNTLLPEGSGWILLVASDINNNGQMVGTGLLDGVERGFVFDLVTETIDAVPLVEGAVFNQAWQINDAGHVIGKANDDIMGGGPFPQGGWGFFWGGPDTEPQLLPSATGLQAIADGINNSDEISGHSDIQDSRDIRMSLWEPDAAGSFTVTALETQVPTKPKWSLQFGFGINDDMWIVGTGRKFMKGKYSWHGVLVVPNQ